MTYNLKVLTFYLIMAEYLKILILFLIIMPEVSQI